MGMLSVPGKILFYGGYSVLVPGHTSLSIAVTDLWGKGATSYFSFGRKRIISEQFGIDIKPAMEGITERNLMVEFAYVLAEHYLRNKGLWKKDITLNLVNSPIFGELNEKSGLGSSAAVIVAVVKSLFLANELAIRDNVQLINKLAQLSNALFTKKASSGFDIAACSYDTSIIYNRYDEKILDFVSDSFDQQVLKTSLERVSSEWQGMKVQQFPFPLDVGVLFFNVKGGKTDTLSCVKRVFEWRKLNPAKFTELMQKQNAAELGAIDSLRAKNYSAVREHTSAARAVHRELQATVSADLGTEISIEPAPISSLIEFAESGCDGVIAGRAPGAGGWDGLAFLVKKGNHEQNIAKITDKAKEFGLFLDYVPLRVL